MNISPCNNTIDNSKHKNRPTFQKRVTADNLISLGKETEDLTQQAMKGLNKYLKKNYSKAYSVNFYNATDTEIITEGGKTRLASFPVLGISAEKYTVIGEEQKGKLPPLKTRIKNILSKIFLNQNEPDGMIRHGESAPKIKKEYPEKHKLNIEVDSIRTPRNAEEIMLRSEVLINKLSQM